MTELDLPRLMEVEAYYGKHPPLHIMVAQYLGVKPHAEKTFKTPSNEINQDQFAQLVEHMPMSEPPRFISPEEYLKKRAQHVR